MQAKNKNTTNNLQVPPASEESHASASVANHIREEQTVKIVNLDFM